MKKVDNEKRLAIESAFRDEGDMLRRWLISRLGDEHDADDVMQSCYLRVLTFAAENTLENPKALIFKTAANIAIDEERRRKRQRGNIISLEKDGPDSPPIDVASELPDCESTLLTKQEINAALSALKKLPRNVQTAFLLNRFQGKTYHEISVSLGVSVSAVEKYMMKAIMTLRNLRSSQTREESSPLKAGESDRCETDSSFVRVMVSGGGSK